jgi:hypothetical protein
LAMGVKVQLASATSHATERSIRQALAGTQKQKDSRSPNRSQLGSR